MRNVCMHRKLLRITTETRKGQKYHAAKGYDVPQDLALRQF